MSTLSNVTHTDSCIKFPLDAIPEAKSTQTGVSVRYVPVLDYKWFVFRVSYGREYLAADFIIADGTYVYLAKRQVLKTVDGKTRKVVEPLIPNILFVYTSDTKAKQYIENTFALPYISYYYNHFQQVDGKNLPLTVPDREMLNFILATCSRNEHLLFVSPSQCHFRGGETVRVTEGAFRGVEGRVARVAGQQRVVVALEGIGLISTAYIPTAFLTQIANPA